MALNRSRVSNSVFLGAALSLVFLVGACSKSSSNIEIDTEYASVFLDNRQIFVGRLEKAEPSYVLLRDVFYIKTWLVGDNETHSKEIKNTISIRSAEPNNPDYTYISTQHILVIEPVAANSKISELIKKAKAEKNTVP